MYCTRKESTTSSRRRDSLDLSTYFLLLARDRLSARVGPKAKHHPISSSSTKISFQVKHEVDESDGPNGKRKRQKKRKGRETRERGEGWCVCQSRERSTATSPVAYCPASLLACLLSCFPRTSTPQQTITLPPPPPPPPKIKEKSKRIVD